MNNHVPGTLLAIRSGSTEGSVRLMITDQDGKTQCYTLFRSDYEKLGEPAAGTLLTEEALDAVIDSSARRKALDCAMRILSCADSNRRTLIRKLIQRGCTPLHAEQATAEMEKRGFLKEEEAAHRAATLSARKGWSRKKVYAYLVSHGFSGTTASSAIALAEELDGVDFAKNRLAFIEKKKQSGMDSDQIRRALWQAGF